MNPAQSLAPDYTAINLRRLIALRNIALAGQFLVVWFAVTSLNMALPVLPLVAVIAAMAVFNLLTWWCMRRPWPVPEPGLFAHLMLDVTALSVLLYFAGGSTNPFVILYLLPLAFTATPVPARPSALSRLEWEHIQKVLTECGGNISETARRLGLHRRTLQRKLAKRPAQA